MASKEQRFRVQVDGHDVDIVIGPGYMRVDKKQSECLLREMSDGWYHIVIGGQSHSVYLPRQLATDTHVDAAVNGKSAKLVVKSARDLLLERFGTTGMDDTADKMVRAPMPGLVLETRVEPGAVVQKGDGLLVLEAMKMENEIRASADGTVGTVHVAPGDAVAKNDLLVELV